jgi:hypothetical protein
LATDADAGGGEDAAQDSAPVDLLDQRFDTNCSGWSFNGGATLVWTPGAGRDGRGACLVNLMSPYTSLVRDISAHQTGYYEVEVWLRAGDGGAPAVQMDLLLPDGGPAGPASFGTNVAAPSTDYVLVQVSATASDLPGNVELRLASLGSSEYYVDSVRLFRTP